MNAEVLPNAKPCGCECACVGIVLNDEDELCLACLHGFHTEDE
jgi:hypothetical protein